MENRQKGFVTSLAIVIIALLMIVGSFKNKNINNASVVNNSNNIAIVNNVPNTIATTTTNNDLWSVFEKGQTALKNKDIAAYNAVSYVQVPADQADQFLQMASFLYNQYAGFNEADFVNKWQDDKQAIYSTNHLKADTASAYGYTASQIMFIKTNNIWKVLNISPNQSWSVSKAGTNKNVAQIEQDLQAMMLDSDKDGVTDQDELCLGARQVDPTCVKTDPNNRVSTNSDGWWDGIWEAMKK